jgi:heme-degrading monooxygenase HmoA
MIHEIAIITIKPGTEAEFEANAGKAVELFKRAKGCLGMELQKGIESPLVYRLWVRWNTVEDHTVAFRESADFQTWRSLVGHCFASPPQVEHTKTVVSGF